MKTGFLLTCNIPGWKTIKKRDSTVFNSANIHNIETTLELQLVRPTEAHGPIDTSRSAPLSPFYIKLEAVLE